MKASEAGAFWERNAETWTRHVRAGYDIYRDALNSPTFLDALPPVEGRRGLDMGCGEGANTRHLARRGARMDGIDIASTFIRHARAAESAEPLGISYAVADGTSLPFAASSFDFVTAFMSLMDMPDIDGVLVEAWRVVRPGGFLQFSILHPCFSPPHRKVLRDPSGETRAVEVADYFNGRHGDVERWGFGSAPAAEKAASPLFEVPRFHRPVAVGRCARRRRFRRGTHGRTACHRGTGSRPAGGCRHARRAAGADRAGQAPAGAGLRSLTPRTPIPRLRALCSPGLSRSELPARSADRGRVVLPANGHLTGGWNLLPPAMSFL